MKQHSGTFLKLTEIVVLIVCWSGNCLNGQPQEQSQAQQNGPKPMLQSDEYNALSGFDHGLPTPEIRQKLYDQLDFQRAVQAVIWAEPAINNALFLQAMERAGVPNLGAMIYDHRMQPGQDVLTPNQSVVYLYDSFNLKTTGPVVHIVPSGPINAGLFDMWMRPVYDFGTVGPNKGKGDRILIVPPDYKGELPEGYQIARVKPYQSFSITRLAITKEMTAEQATAMLRKIQTFPLSQVGNPPTKVFVAMGDPAHGGKEFRIIRPRGVAYWQLLHDIVDAETVEDRDRITLGTLDSIGISKGQPFHPDARMQKILIDADSTGLAMMINEAFSPRTVPLGVTKELYAGTHWENIQLLPSMTQEGPNLTYVTGRMIGFYQANGAQFAWDPRDYPPGFGQKYAAAYMDKNGAWLKGEMNYRLHVPPNVPVKDFWSLAVYDIDTRALIETDQHRAEINPNVTKLAQNPDGSVDLYLGPTAPAGKELNWIKTIPGKAWFVYFRWYGPLEAYYDKSWRLSDFEPIQ